jgi:hypothetical protein
MIPATCLAGTGAITSGNVAPSQLAQIEFRRRLHCDRQSRTSLPRIEGLRAKIECIHLAESLTYQIR